MTNGTRRGWGVSVTPRPLFTSRKDPVHIVQEAGWAPGPVWTGAVSLAPPPGFDPRTVQPVASLYTDYATWPTCSIISLWKPENQQVFWRSLTVCWTLALFRFTYQVFLLFPITLIHSVRILPAASSFNDPIRADISKSPRSRAGPYVAGRVGLPGKETVL